MTSAFHELLARLGDSPALQGLLAALATFVLEDPTTVGSGLLVADGRMAFATALIGVSVGIAVGDVGLYGIGRGLGPRLAGRGPLTHRRLERARAWFDRNLVTAVVLSRFVPGMRLPTYVAAGLAEAPVGRFAAVALAASLVWTALLLTLTVRLGAAVLPLLGRFRWPIAGLALVLLVVAQRSAAGRLDRRERARDPATFSRFELWPPWLFYLPVAAWWGWLALRHRGLMLPTAANPSIYGGGFIGESKRAILDLVPASHRHWIAPWIVLRREAGEPPEAGATRALAALAAAGLELPVVAKPDVGQRGVGVRPIRDRAALECYLAEFPPGHDLLLQRLVGATPPVAACDTDLGSAREAGVLWFRRPGEDRGRVFSMTLKIFPELVGDGARTVAELIAADPRASRLGRLYRRRLRRQLGRVLAPGERLPLVFAGNHCQGTIFRDGTGLVTPALAARIEDLAGALPDFWFGRFDIRFDDLEAFLAGDDLAIVEINGASAEATHIWDAGARLGGAYRTLFRQFAVLFEIGAANRRRGVRPLPVRRLLGDLRRYRRLAGAYPATR